MDFIKGILQNVASDLIGFVAGIAFTYCCGLLKKILSNMPLHVIA